MTLIYVFTEFLKWLFHKVLLITIQKEWQYTILHILNIISYNYSLYFFYTPWYKYYSWVPRKARKKDGSRQFHGKLENA